jgi:Family of unknown function (DUF6502)
VGVSAKEAVLNVFAALVRPLMRVAFEYGITASEIAGVVRRTYIQSLEKRLLEQKRPTTDARLAIVGGLSRSEVVALREALRAGAPHSMRGGVTLDQITSLLTIWHTHTNFSGAYGLAMDLDLVPIPDSPRRHFRELVEIACPNVDRDALLDELIAAGSVEVIDSSTVRCLSRAYVPRGADVTRIERMGRFLGVVTGNFVHNLLRSETEPAYFERAVVSDDALTDRGRDEFLDLGGQRSQELLAELDTFLTGLAGTESSATGKRYGVGIYFFEDDSVQSPMDRNKSNDLKRERTKPTVPQEIDVLAAVGKKD